MKRTPLYEKHVKMGGKMVDFSGWELPIQYIGILEEHHQVRNGAGLFDVSHMGEITVKGPFAESYLQKLITNDLSSLKNQQVLYSPMCDQDGGVVDDLLVYKLGKENYLLVVNASNTDKDFAWMQENLEEGVAEEGVTEKGVTLENVSAAYAQLALQGPKAEGILQKLTSFPLKEIRFFYFEPKVNLAGLEVLVSRTGYTGEDGFELYLPSAHAPALWQALMDAGKAEGLMPIGLGARDTLRFEAALPLYGQEISPDISPLEAGLDKFVKLPKTAFNGKEALEKQKQQGLVRKLAGFEMLDRGIPRSHYVVAAQGTPIGFVTTGSFSPSLHKNIGLALVPVEYAKEDATFDIMIRDKAIKAHVIPIPFYHKKYKK